MRPRWGCAVLVTAVATGCAGTPRSRPIAAAKPAAAPCLASSTEPGAVTEYFPQQALDDHRRSWFSSHLRALSEPALFRCDRDTQVHAYRFLWLRSFHHPIAVRLDVHSDGGGTLTVKETDGMGGYEPRALLVDRTSHVSASGVREFLSLMTQLQFWTIPALPP